MATRFSPALALRPLRRLKNRSIFHAHGFSLFGQNSYGRRRRRRGSYFFCDSCRSISRESENQAIVSSARMITQFSAIQMYFNWRILSFCGQTTAINCTHSLTHTHRPTERRRNIPNELNDLFGNDGSQVIFN